jgi:hypothetical protein
MIHRCYRFAYDGVDAPSAVVRRTGYQDVDQ